MVAEGFNPRADPQVETCGYHQPSLRDSIRTAPPRLNEHNFGNAVLVSAQKDHVVAKSSSNLR